MRGEIIHSEIRLSFDQHPGGFPVQQYAAEQTGGQFLRGTGKEIEPTRFSSTQ